MRPLPSIILAGLLAAPLGAALGGSCEVTSAPTRTPLIELYTSEGCSSCPPADRWLGHFRQADDVVALAFHVDYWDNLGWPDRFADPRNSQRQRDWARLTGASTVYTPQILVNGVDARAWRGGDPLAGQHGRPAGARIHLQARMDDSGTTVTANASSADAHTRLLVARYENGHETAVHAGENRGATLHHDFVAREWFTRALPASGPLKAQWRFQAGEHAGGIAAFVEDTRTGEVLQAVALPDCRG
ncbi:DUF1223 domain-containing protein [Nitrogeniibacter mangrovi]|uniref:DUF1223 domain-containing protein n=1 Tax=Nitrogeniibacter mangrovi TaxID=2016596 RepID=A0A6C1B3M1_9RHOO|nr:DUF1223 domain-containing protein [Nitrogeniibacter mangrovi]QID18261.1 DUF1223 domain-containing protein [Nitrogeniibacter mangrovi]